MLNIKALLTKLIGCSYTEREENGWYIKKYANGRYEAIRIRNYGQITLGTSVSSNWRRSAELSIDTLPSDIPADAQIEVEYLGNSSNSAVVLEKTSQTAYFLAKAITSSVTLQDNMFFYRIVGGYSIT